MIAAGSVRTHAISMFLMVATCSPDPFAAMAPATPDDSTCVVETGRPKMWRARGGGGARVGRSALRVGEVGLADLLADGDHDALPADHGAEAERDRDRDLDPARNELGRAVERTFVAVEGRHLFALAV